jgi:hypothetical protein
MEAIGQNKFDVDELEDLLGGLEQLHRMIMNTVRQAVAGQIEYDDTYTQSGYGDVSYAVDTKSEALIVAWFQQHAPARGVVLVSEGIGARTFPEEMPEESAKWRIIMDPLDGTRHIMYDNRSCWILSGIAPNYGDQTTLKDIRAAIQTEVPTSLQEKAVLLRAVRGHGVRAKVIRIASASQSQEKDENTFEEEIHFHPSTARGLENGFVVFSNFFPGTKAIISDIEERMIAKLLGGAEENGCLVFSEQYISNAGQLFMLLSGRYRMVADIRAALSEWRIRNGKSLPLCSHPYDICTMLIAEESGCLFVSETGDAFNAPLDLHTNCSWIGYANENLMRLAQPALESALRETWQLPQYFNL